MDEVKLAAFWLTGIGAAFKERGYPSWLCRRDFFRHELTAHRIAAGGKVGGPVPLWELLSYSEELSKRLTPPLRFQNTNRELAAAQPACDY